MKKKTAKTVKKTRKKSSAKKCVSGRNGVTNLTPGNPGNSGGKKGRSGRKPNEFKAFCNKLLMTAKVQKMIQKKAEEGDIKAIELAAKYTQSLPKQSVEVEAKGGVLAVPMPMDSKSWAEQAKVYDGNG